MNMKIVRESLNENPKDEKFEKAISKFNFKKHPIVKPPKDREELIKLMLQDAKKQFNEDPNTKIYFKDVVCTEKDLENGKLEKQFRKLTTKALQHEVLHMIQGEKLPELYKEFPKGEEFWDKIFDEDFEHKVYLSLPYEIMAYAFSVSVGDLTSSNLRSKTEFIRKPTVQKYKEIGGKVYELFKHYLEEYKKWKNN